MLLNLQEKFISIIDIARYAPSVHNSQPWLTHLEDDGIVVEIDPAHQLSDGDPTGRQTIISLGIFSEAICIAAKSLGFASKTVAFRGSSVLIRLTRTQKISENDLRMAAYLKTRATDRSIYEQVSIPEESLRKITVESLALPYTKVWVLDDRESVERIAGWTAQGIGVAMSNADFREELSHFLVNPWSKQKRGISTASLYIPKPLAIVEPLLMRLGIGLGTEVNTEKKRWLSASAVVLITATGDMPEFWFAAGRTYLRVSLVIESEGISQATSAATVEASNFHEDVESLIKTNQRLQSVIRIGKGSQTRVYSPRVSPEELITSS